MGVISYASRATTAPIHQAISAVDTSFSSTTTTPSSTTTLVADASASASTSPIPSSAPSDGDLPNYIPWYFVLFAIPFIFVLVAVWSLVQDRLEDKRKAARAGEEDIELRALERHWFPWREALDEDEVGHPTWRRASPPPPPDRRTKKEIAAAKAAAAAAAAKKQKAREEEEKEALANATRSSTPNTVAAEAAGPSYSRHGEPSGRQTQTRHQAAAAQAPRSPSTSLPSSPSASSHVTQLPFEPVSSRRRSPRSDLRVADLEGVFVVGTDSSDDESEPPRGRTQDRQRRP